MDDLFKLELDNGVLYVDHHGHVTYEGVDGDGYAYLDSGTLSQADALILSAHVLDD